MKAFPTRPMSCGALALSCAFAIPVAAVCEPLLANERFTCEWLSKVEGSTGETLPAVGALDFSIVPDESGLFAIHREGLGTQYEGRAMGDLYVGQTMYDVDEITYQEFVSIDRFSLMAEWVTRLGEIEVVYSGQCRLSR